MFLGRKVKRRIGAGIGALAFLLLFGGIGVLCLYAIVATVYDGLRARSWVPVEADITFVDTGQVAYAYRWGGAKHVGDRPGTFVLRGSSGADDWDDRMDAMISDAVDGKKPVTAYVNPQDPRESMLDREIRWKLLAVFLPFGVGFTGAGLAAAWLIGRKALGLEEGGAGVPLLKPRAREALMQWGMGLVWNSVALPIAFVGIPGLWASGEWFPVILLLVFPVIGVLIVWSALHTTVAAFRDGGPFNARTA